MLTPEQYAELPVELVKQMLALEDAILDDIARRLSKNLQVTESALNQLEILLRAGNDLDEIHTEIAKRMNVSKDIYLETLKNASRISYESDLQAYLSGGKKLVPYSQNHVMQQMVEALIRNADHGFDNLINTIGFVQDGRFTLLDDWYRNQLGQGAYQVASGAFDVNTVVRNVVRTMTLSGVRMIDYDNTRPYHVDAAAKRAIRTTVRQISGQMSEMNADMMGQDLMEITAHSGARPEHAEWQGQIVSRSGKDRRYLSTLDIGYGEVTGFKGANCRHDWHPYFEGSERMWSKKALREIDNEPFEYDGREYTHYEATQRMRQLERNMRKTKRELIGYDAAGLKDDFTAKSIYLRRQREQYFDFANSAGLKPQLENVGVFGYNRSVSSKSVWAAKPYLKEKLDYVWKGQPGIIPKNTYFKSTRTIAGQGTDVELKVAKELANSYGGHPSVWTKHVGKIESKYHYFDVHWYGNNSGNQFRVKLKYRGNKK